MGIGRAVDQEVWFACPDGRGLYDVSNMGRVRSWNNNRWGRRSEPKLMKLSRSSDGYLTVNLGRGVIRRVHLLVCTAFHGQRPEGHEAAHGNGVQTDNRADNLRWATPLENIADQLAHGTRRRGEQKSGVKLTAADVLEIRRLRAAGVRNQDIAERFGIAPTTASPVARGKKWTHIGGQHGA